MPYPPPATCQFFLWAAVASSRRGYQASVTVIVRPSRRPTLNVSLVNFTSETRSSAVSAKMPMPSLQALPLLQFHELVQHEAAVVDFVLDEVDQHAADGLLGLGPAVEAALCQHRFGVAL